MVLSHCYETEDEGEVVCEGARVSVWVNLGERERESHLTCVEANN